MRVIIDDSFNGRLIAVPLNSNTATVWLDADAMAALLRNHGISVDFMGL